MAASARFREYLLKKARQNLVTCDYSSAFAHYLLYIKIDNDLCGEILDEFVSCMCHWTELLNSLEQNEQLAAAFSQARAVCGFSDSLMCALGEQALRLERFSTALHLMRGAQQSFPQSMSVLKTSEHVSYGAVERWHFKMLNDLQRNKGYHDAIRLAVQKYNVSSVLDIGCGTGLLSLFADMAGAREVTMCDAALVMTEICSAVVDSYCQEKQVSKSQLRVLHEASTNLSVPGQLHERVDLIVTEIFDAALFGEHCLFSLSHAWTHLIKNSEHNKGRVIPESAQLYVCAIECPEIRKENWVKPANIPLLDLSSVNIVCKTSVTEEEPYTTEDLFSVRNSYKFLSPIQQLMAVNFNDPQNLDELSDYSSTFMLDIYTEGQVDALAVWFDLDLCEGVKVSTAPNQKCCWEQAIFPVMSYRPSENKQQDATGGWRSPTVKCGDQLKISCTLNDGCLHLTLEEIAALGYFMNTCCISGQPSAFSVEDLTGAPALPGDTCRAELDMDVDKENFESVETPVTGCDRQQGKESSLTPSSAIVETKLSVSLSEGNPHRVEQGCVNSSSHLDTCISAAPPCGSVCETESSTVRDVSFLSNGEQETLGVDIQAPNYILANHSSCETSACDFLVDKNDKATNSKFAGQIEIQKCGQGLTHANQSNLSALKSDFGASDDGVNSCDNSRCDSQSVCTDQETCANYVNKQREDSQTCQTNNTNVHSSSQESSQCLSLPGFGSRFYKHQQKTSVPPANPTSDSSCSNAFFLRRSEIRHLNDSKVHTLHASALQWVIKHYACQRMISISSRFPLCGILALKLGVEKVDLCYTGVEDRAKIKTLVERMRQMCSVEGNRLQWLEGNVAASVEEYEESVRLGAVCIDVMETEGCLRAKLMDELQYLRPVMRKDSVVLPQAVDVYAVIINSPLLHTMSSVTSVENTIGLSIAPHINQFQTCTFLDLDIHALPHSNLSDVAHVFRLDIQSCLTGKATTVSSKHPFGASEHSDANTQKHSDSVFSQSKQLCMKIRESGTATALAFWFEMTIAPGISMSTIDPETHWKQAAHMLYGGKVEQGQEVIVEARLEKSYLHFSLA